MKRDYREKILRQNLDEIVNSPSEFASLISRDPKTSKVVMYIKENGKVIMDVPFKTMRTEDKTRFRETFGNKFKVATYAFTTKVSPDEATKLTERVFTEIYRARPDFDLDCEIEFD